MAAWQLPSLPKFISSTASSDRASGSDSCHWSIYSREYGLLTEAHTQLSVVRNCSSVCSGGEETAGGQGVVSSSMGWGEDRQYTGRENLEQFPTTES
jgi:hypothetical protein